MDDAELISSHSLRRFKHNSRRVQQEISTKYLKDAKDCQKEIQDLKKLTEELCAALKTT